MSQLTQTRIAPGGKEATILLPPPLTVHESDRTDATDALETEMVGQMRILRAQTVEKNKEFQRQTDAIEARGNRLSERIRAEAATRDESFRVLKERFEASLLAATTSMTQHIDRVWQHLEEVELQPAVDRRAEILTDWDHFCKATVPETNEEQSGPVVRQMLHTRDTFEIENTKIRAREAAIKARMDDFEAKTDKRHNDEATDRYVMFTKLRESLHEQVASDNREEEHVQVQILCGLRGARDDLKNEAKTREAEDVVTLEGLQASMETLQQQILQNFGAEVQ